MSKTYRYLVDNKFTGTKPKNRKGEALARFKREKTKQDERLFKREVNFTNYIIATSKED